MSFEQVGVQAIVQDQATFISNINNVTNQTINNMSKISSAARQMEAQSEKAFDGFASAFIGAFAAMGVERLVANAVGALETLGAKALEIGAEFEYGFSQATASMQATEDEARQLEDSLMSVAQNSSTTLNHLVDAFGDLGKAGVKPTDIINGVGQALTDFVDASAGSLGAEKAANFLAAAMNVFGIEAEDVTRITDSMTGAVIKSTAGYADMVNGAAQLNDVMAALNFTIEDEATWLGVLSNRGLKGATAGRSLKAMLLGLQDPSDEAQKLMTKYGISLTNLDGTLTTSEELFYRINTALNKLSPSERLAAEGILFTSDSIRAADAIVNSSTDDFINFKRSIDGVSTKKLADEIKDNLQPQLIELQNTIDTVVIAFTNSFIPVITQGVKIAKEMLKSLDPEIPKAFGAALASIFTGSESGMPDFSKMFGPEVGEGINQFMTVLLTLRDAIVNQIVPAFVEMVTQFLNLLNVTHQQETMLPSLVSVIKAVGTAVSDAMLYVATFFNVLSQNRETVAIFVAILEGIAVAFGITLVVAIASGAVAIASALIAILGPALLVGVAAGVVVAAWKVFPAQMAAIASEAVAAVTSIFNAFMTLPNLFVVIMQVLDASLQGWGMFFQAQIQIVAQAVGVIGQIFALGLNALVTIETAIGTVLLTIFSRVWTAMSNVVRLGLTAIINVLNEFLGLVPPVVTAWGRLFLIVWNRLWNGLSLIVGRAINNMLTGIRTLINAVPGLRGLGIFGDIGGNVGPPPMGTVPDLGDFGGQQIGPLQQIADDIGGAVSDAIGNIGDVAKGAADQVANAVATAGAAIGIVGNIVKAEIGKLVGQFSQTVGKIKGDAGKLYDDVNATIEKLRKAQEAADAAERERKRKADEMVGDPSEKAHPPPGQPEPDPGKGKGGGGGGKPKGAGAGDKPTAAEELQAIKDLVGELLIDLPGVTQDLIDFLAELEKATPGRLAGMVQALMDSRDIIGEMLVVKLKLVAASAELVGVEKRIAAIDSQIAIIDAEWAIKRIGYEQQLLALKVQQNAIDQQLLPFKRQLLQIDYAIHQLQLEDYGLAEKRAQLEYDALPVRYAIKDIEEQITKLTDKRLALTQREEEIRNRLAQMGTDESLTKVNTGLDKAWASMDVPAILALEKQKQALEEQQKAQQAQADALQNQIEKQSLLNELQAIPLEQQKLSLEEKLAPIERENELLGRQQELQKALNDIAIARLNGEKQAIEQLMAPLEFQRQQIQLEMDQVNLLKDAEQFAFDARKLQYEAMKASEELRQADLKETIRVQDELMGDLVEKFAEGLAASGAFTLAESFEVAKRMKFWNDQIAKIGEIATEFNRVKGEVDKLTEAIKAIPTDVTVHVNVVTSTSEGGPPSGTTPGYQHGGIVPGAYGQPQLAIVHGGEHFLGIGRKSTAVRMAESTRTSGSQTSTSNTSNTNVNVSVPLPMVSTSAQRQMLMYKLNDIVRGTRR